MHQLIRLTYGIGLVTLGLMAVVLGVTPELVRYNPWSGMVADGAREFPSSWGRLIASKQYLGNYDSKPFVGLTWHRFASGREILQQQGVATVYFVDTVATGPCGELGSRYLQYSEEYVRTEFTLPKPCRIFRDGLYNFETGNEIVINQAYGLNYADAAIPLDDSAMIVDWNGNEALLKFSPNGKYLSVAEPHSEFCFMTLRRTSDGTVVTSSYSLDTPLSTACDSMLITFSEDESRFVVESGFGLGDAGDDRLAMVQGDKTYSLWIPLTMAAGLTTMEDVPQYKIDEADPVNDIRIFEVSNDRAGFYVNRDTVFYRKGSYYFDIATQRLSELMGGTYKCVVGCSP